jgi:hypothetical protein
MLAVSGRIPGAPTDIATAPGVDRSGGRRRYIWVKSEFLYVKFDDYTTFTTGPFLTMNVSPREVKLEDYIWRAVMNYKFW